MDTTLQKGRLPSLSSLTGVVRPATAAAAYEKAYDEQQRHVLKYLSTAGTSKMTLGGSLSKPQTPKPQTPKPQTPSENVGSLSKMASKHMTNLDRNPGMPYQRIISPAERTALQKEVGKKLQQMAARYQKEEEEAAVEAASVATAAGAATTASGPETSSIHTDAASPSGYPADCLSPRSRPCTPSIPMHNMVMQRPSSRQMCSKSWIGPLSSLAQQEAAAAGPALLPGPLSRLGTPMSRMNPQRMSMPQLMQGRRGPPPAASSGMLKAAGGMLLRPSTSAGGVAGAAPGVAAAIATITRRKTAALETFTTSRGLLYSVFQDLDTLDQGRITFSMFEEAALLVGMKEEQAKKLFHMLDQEKRGYASVQDWGRKDMWPYMSEFARLFLQRTRGQDGRYKDTKEINNLYAALQMALMKLKLKNSGRSISHERLIQAFSFIDRDSNGVLDRGELLDAFDGMGIYVSQKVIDDAMNTFDSNSSGAIEYSEFISVLYPNLCKGYKMGQ